MIRVGLDPDFRRRYPHQSSGGQRQPIGIARALAVKPRFMDCDEAIAALEVSIQTQVIKLFIDLPPALVHPYTCLSSDPPVDAQLDHQSKLLYVRHCVAISLHPD